METEPKQPEETAKEKKASPLEISEETKTELSALFEGKEWKGKKFPPVYLKLFSGPHATAEDAKGIKSLLDESDIYVPEIFGWSPDMISMLWDISTGYRIPPKREEFFDEIFQYLFRTKKTVALIDVPEKEVKKSPELFNEKEYFFEELKDLSYEEAIQFVLENITSVAETISVNREEYMINHFAEKIRDAMFGSSHLREKDKVKVLMTLGDAHSAIYHELQKIGKEHVSRDFRYPLAFSSTGEAERSIVFGKEVSEEIKARSLLETMISEDLYRLLYGISTNSNKNESFLRYVSSQFSAEEIRTLFEQWKNYRDGQSDFIILTLGQKNITLPKNEEELDAILAKTTFGKYQATLKEKEQQKNGK